jgi:hypothetical protein
MAEQVAEIAINSKPVASVNDNSPQEVEEEHPLCFNSQEKKVQAQGEDEWIEITESFRSLSAELAPGELMHDSRFSLVDSMTAVEFMDPRMDLYIRSKWTSHGPISSKEALNGLVELQTFKDTDVVGIVDELVSLVTTWLDGNTLAQTVFTCIYLHDPSKIKHPLLRNFLLCISACVERMRKNLARAEVCVDDDHQTVTIGLNTDMSTKEVDSAVAQLKEVEDTLHHTIKKSLRGGKSLKEDTSTSVGPDLRLQKGLLARVRMVRSLVLFLDSPGVDRGNPSVPPQKDLIVQCISGCQDMRETLDLGSVFEDAEQQLQYGFHEAINNVLLPPSPRQVTKMSRSEGADYLLRCLEGFQEAIRIRELPSLREIQSSVMILCVSPDLSNVMIRSFLKNTLLDMFRATQDDHCTLESLIRQDIRHFNHPSSLNPKTLLGTSTKAKDLVDKLLVQFVSPIQESVLLYCDHRSRHQEKITYCLNHLGELQLEVEATDHLLQQLAEKNDPQREHSKLYSFWLLRVILILMIDYVNVGIEFNLYTLGETHYALWYLDYLYGCLCRILKGAKQSTEKEWNHTSKSGKQKAKLKKSQHHKDLEREILLMTVKKVMCSALMRAIEAAAADQKLPPLATRFSKEELRYRHRFSAFGVVATPRLRMHSEYIHELSISAYSGRHTNLFTLASKGFMAAKSSLEGMPPNDTTRSLLKTIKTNMVICNLAVTGRHKEDTSLLTLDYTSHRHFPILRLL